MPTNQSDPPLVYFNGIDGSTGGYHLAPHHAGEEVAILESDEPLAESTTGDDALPMAKQRVLATDGEFAVPATIDLAGAEIELVSLVARENRLRNALTLYLQEEESAGRRFDYVFIDCPPSLGLLTVNALTAGEEMLIPIQCEYYALEGVTQLMRTLEQVRERDGTEQGTARTQGVGDARRRCAVAGERSRH